MAIVQISRITQRQGLESDLPQPLAGAELGWAIDQRRLFIGNGTIADGAPVVGNTEVLTEFSDILSFTTNYTYKGQAAGYEVQTGVTSNAPVSQSLQSRLDSYAVITDFGATGDGSTDVTAAINRALYQMFCRDNNPAIRRSLFFPAGTYIITDTLLIPPYCKLYGEGAESTIISFNVQQWTSTIVYASGVLVENSGSYYRSQSEVPIGTLIGNATYWQAESLPEYVVRTADSLQQTGVNIATNGATPPQAIEISGMKFTTNVVNNGILIQNASDCFFDAVTVTGPLTTADLNTNIDDIAAIRWASTVSLVCSNINWNNCKFSGFTFGTNTDQQIDGATISNSVFDTLYRGAVFGSATPVNGGPSGVRLVQNIFDNIYLQGIIFDTVGLNASAYNTFYDVGNHFAGTTIPASSIIDINANSNISVGDMFSRNDGQAVTYPRIELNDTNTMAMSMNSYGLTFNSSGTPVTDVSNTLNLGTYQRVAGIQDTLINNSGANLVVANKTLVSSFKCDYSITRDVYKRTGTLTVTGGQSSGTTGFSYVDDYVENGSTGVTLTPSDTGTQLVLAYTTTNTGATGSIKYSITTFGI